MQPKSLISYYPLHVVYPHGGTVYILSWSGPTVPKGVICARSTKAVEATLAEILDHRPWVAVAEYIRAELVAPPLWFQNRYAELWGSIYLDDFKSWVGYCLRSNDPLPKGLGTCPRCKDLAKWTPWCGECIQGVIVEGESWCDFYWRNREAYHTHSPKVDSPYVNRPSEAREILETEELHGIGLDPGYFEAVTKHLHPDHEIQFLTWGAFYTNPQEVDPTKVLRMVEQSDIRWKEKREYEGKDHELVRAKRLADNREFLISLLDGKVTM